MSPNQQPQKRNRKRGNDHRCASKNRPAREIRNHLRNDPHARQNRDVNLRMPEEPEKVLPKQRRSAAVRYLRVRYQQSFRNEKTRARSPVEQNQQSRRQQNRE